MSELVEYAEGEPFPGRIGKTVEQSSPAWPAPNRAKSGAPNVFALDDVGFGQRSPSTRKADIFIVRWKDVMVSSRALGGVPG